jgi:hypothetical protein
MRIAIIVSVMAHLGVMVIVALWPGDDDSKWPSLPELALAMAQPPPPPPIHEEPIAVVWLGEIGPVATSHATSPGPSQQRGSKAISTAGRGAGPETSKSGAKHSALMDMRAVNEKPKLKGMSGDFLAKILNDTKPLDPHGDATVDIDAQIANVRGQMGMHARINPDYDASDDLAKVVALREQKNQVELKPQKDGTFAADRGTYVAKVERDGTVHLHDRANWQQHGLFDATFDVTDGFMRAHKQDPYAADKLRFLDRTRDQRVRIGTEYRKEVAAHAREYMTANLVAAWASTSDLRKRKQILFELWDDCAEAGSEQEVTAGRDAREMVVRWIQMKLVGPDAYTATELITFNKKKTSKQSFAPYE